MKEVPVNSKEATKSQTHTLYLNQIKIQFGDQNTSVDTSGRQVSEVQRREGCV